MHAALINRFAKAKAEYEGLLIEMRANLESYAAKPDASEKYIARQNQVLAAMYRYLSITAEVVQAMAEATESEKKAAFSRGMEAQKLLDAEYAQSKLRGQDKETARFNSVSRAIKQWPELF